MSSSALHLTSGVLSLTAFTFFLIGVIGYSNENTTVENVNWFHRDGSGSNAGQNYYVGLSRIVMQQGGVTGSYVYDTADCGDLCNVCKKQGENALGLLVISVIFSFFSTGLSFAGAASPVAAISGANIATSFVAGLFGVIGWGLFVNICFHKIVREVDGDFDYGAGSILTLIAFFLMFIVVVLQIAATAMAAPAPAAAPKAEPTPAPVPTDEI